MLIAVPSMLHSSPSLDAAGIGAWHGAGLAAMVFGGVVLDAPSTTAPVAVRRARHQVRVLAERTLVPIFFGVGHRVDKQWACVYDEEQ
jgi:hypothetical protein